MNFNRIKALAITILLPFAATIIGGAAQAMNPSSPCEKADDEIDIFAVFEKEERERNRKQKADLGILMEPRYFTENYNKKYATDDLRRIIRGTFDASRYFKQFSDSRTLCGPWRRIAFKKSENDPQFKNFIADVKKRQKMQYKLVMQIATGTDDTGKLPDAELLRAETRDTGFERFVDVYRKAWNEAHDYKNKVESYEDAFKKALLILKQVSKGKDPFNERRVEILYDAKMKIYLVQKTVDSRLEMRPFTDDGINFIVLHENGEVLTIDAEESCLQSLE